MTNPFAEKRKNERINKLVKENEELKFKFSELEKQFESKKFYSGCLEQAVKFSQSQTQELVGILKELIPLANDGYAHHKLQACHQDLLEDDRELLNSALNLLSKFNP